MTSWLTDYTPSLWVVKKILNLADQGDKEELTSYISLYGDTVYAVLLEDGVNEEELNNPPYFVWSNYMTHTDTILPYHAEHAAKFMEEEYWQSSVEVQKKFFFCLNRHEKADDIEILQKDFDIAAWALFHKILQGKDRDTLGDDLDTLRFFAMLGERLWRGHGEAEKTPENLKLFYAFVQYILFRTIVPQEDMKHILKMLVEGTEEEAGTVAAVIMTLSVYGQEILLPFLEKRNDALAELPYVWLEAVYGQNDQPLSSEVKAPLNLKFIVNTTARELFPELVQQ